MKKLTKKQNPKSVIELKIKKDLELKPVQKKETEDLERELDNEEPELEQLVNNPVRERQRNTVSPTLEIAEPVTQLEREIENTPAPANPTTPTNYVTASSAYQSAQASYETNRGDYDEAGYPKIINSREISSPSLEIDPGNLNPNPLFRQNSAWGGSEIRQEKKYESIEDRGRKDKERRRM